MSKEEEEFCNPNKVCKNMEHVHYDFTPESWQEKLKKDGKLKDKNIINFPIQAITDEEFKIAIKAIFGPYKGSGYNPE